jgi:Cof subfamily protein (haloacid dehalogenase superfamily)
MSIKLIITDIDGTLAIRGQDVTTRTAETLRRAADRGVMVTIATGRTPLSARKFLCYVSPDAPVVFANGALVETAETGRLLYKRCLLQETVREVWNRAPRIGLVPVAWTDSTLYIEAGGRDLRQYQKLTMTLAQFVTGPDAFARDNIIKMLWTGNDPALIAAALEALAADPPANANWFTSDPCFIEFVHREVTKGAGLRRLAESCGFAPEEIMAVGDEMNDISMLEFAGLSVAMGNALEPVRQAADYVTASCYEDGLAQAVERFVL